MAELKLADGDYGIEDLNGVFGSQEFRNEKELCDFVEANIDAFCMELGISMAAYERESYITRIATFGKGNRPRVDFLIKETGGGVTLVEAKHPRNLYREVNMAISQILDYILIAEKEGIKVNKAVILTSACNRQVLEIIKRFELPIDVVLISKDAIAVWQKEVG